LKRTDRILNEPLRERETRQTGVFEVHELQIRFDQPLRVWPVKAETDLVGDFPLFIFPEYIRGRFLELSKDQLLELDSGEAVTIIVSGKRYKLDGRITSEGAFTLRKIQYLSHDESSEIVP